MYQDAKRNGQWSWVRFFSILAAMGIADCERLLPPIVDGASVSHPLSAAAAATTGLPRGLPVVLCYLDVVCTGRFYDFIERRADVWGLVRRQPIYEKDRMDVVNPAGSVELDPARLAAYPDGYRHLAYLQREQGFDVKDGLPGLTGAAVELLYAEGAAWLDGSPTPGVPL